jgi:hypothetical protein
MEPGGGESDLAAPACCANWQDDAGTAPKEEGVRMAVLILSGVLVLVLGGCVCVVWAERDGPRWARAVAAATLTAGELVRRTRRTGRSRSPNQLGGSDG